MPYLKYHKNPIRGQELKTNRLKFGLFGLKALESGQLGNTQILTIKKLIGAIFKREFKVWFRFFPPVAKTVKPAGSRMGSGKGNIGTSAVKVRKGQVFLEWSFLTFDNNTKVALQLLAKLSIKAAVVTKGL